MGGFIPCMCSLLSSDLRRFGEWQREQNSSGYQAILPTGLPAVEKGQRSSRVDFGVWDDYDVPVGFSKETGWGDRTLGILS